MRKYGKWIFLGGFFLLSFFGLLFFLQENSVAVLNPKGIIALKQKKLLGITTFFMLLIVLPVFFLTGFIAWKYRASNQKAKYDPLWDKNHFLEGVWWFFPFVIVAILSFHTWKSCHELDPFKPLDPRKEAVKVQAVALQWKWLFIYPDYGIASLNYLEFPEKTPIDFEITSDAPMNAIWIPELGGQIYAMAGMSSKLHLMADQEGEYRGASANISGNGFAGMEFVAKASNKQDFSTWIDEVKKKGKLLTWELYEDLVKPSEYVPPEMYRLELKDLYEKIIMKYEAPVK